MSSCELLSANAAADALAAGDLTSEQLVETLLARIERTDARLGAFVAVYADEARAAARAADLARRAGHSVGRFHGVPIALKDLIDLEGRITTGGSKIWEARVSETTATLARRLVAAGIIVLGKTRTVEFAMGGPGGRTGTWAPRGILGTLLCTGRREGAAPAPGSRWARASHRGPSGPIPGARCASPPPGTG